MNGNGTGPTKGDERHDAQVIIVGAGAVGLLTALKLGKAGLRVIVLEAHPQILQAPRAIAYMAVVAAELEKVGILDNLKAVGLMNKDGVAWRRFTGEQLAGMSPGQPLLTLGQDKLAKTILTMLEETCPTVEVLFGHRCVGISQENGRVKVMTTAGFGERIFEAQFLVGCDGANSAIRRMSMIPFEGFTWKDFRFVACDVEYDFSQHSGFRTANFIVDPVNWAVIARTGRENVWRVCYGEDPATPIEGEVFQDRTQLRVSNFVKASNKDGDLNFRIVRSSPYWCHQKCAQTFRKGNVLLAGDAAHSNNPVGGLGLTGGLLDAAVVGNALIRHLKDLQPNEVISQAVESRRKVWKTVVDQMSQENLRRLFSTDEADNMEREGFFKMLKESDARTIDSMASFKFLLPDLFE